MQNTALIVRISGLYLIMLCLWLWLREMDGIAVDRSRGAATCGAPSRIECQLMIATMPPLFVLTYPANTNNPGYQIAAVGYPTDCDNPSPYPSAVGGQTAVPYCVLTPP